MANRFLGEATVESGGRTYTLRCDFNAMCEFEEVTGENALDAFQKYESGSISIKTMRAMMWAFMLHHQPDTTLAEAGAVMSEDPEVLRRVIEAASPTADEAKGLGNGQAKKGAKRA